jgi:excisionase family DNA binding protein
MSSRVEGHEWHSVAVRVETKEPSGEGHRKVREFQGEHEILTVPEVAIRLRVSKAHVHNLINGRVSGVRPLPAIPFGRRRLVRRASLESWMKTNERLLAGDMLPSSPEVDAVGA